MLPKKGRKEIVVDDVLYHYKVSGCVSVAIQNSETGEKFFWYEEWKPKWKLGLKPSGIREIIENHNKGKSCA